MKKYTDYDIMSMLIESRTTYEEYRYKIRERLSIMVLNESTENYLEAILMLSSKLPVVRSVDIANEHQHCDKESQRERIYNRDRCRIYLSDRER